MKYKIEWLDDELTRARVTRKAKDSHWWNRRYETARCYALPTCSSPGVALPLHEIGKRVAAFKAVAAFCSDLHFFVSEVGCGFAGYTPAEIAPLFAGAPENCDLPPGWRI